MVILLLALVFSVIFVVTGILIIFGLSALAIGFFYYNITDGSLVAAVWIIPVLLVLVIAILIILGWLSVIPPKFNRKEKTSFKLRVFNIIILKLLKVLSKIMKKQRIMYMGFVGGLLVGALGTWYLMENPEAKAKIISIIIDFLQKF